MLVSLEVRLGINHALGPKLVEVWPCRGPPYQTQGSALESEEAQRNIITTF